MEVWHAYIDESYNTKSFCVGGFVARATTWVEVSAKWSERIAYENRRSNQKGFLPIARYHATDCANLKRDFSAKNGWSIDRQIALTKRLCEIIGHHTMGGIVVGGGIAHVLRHIAPEESPEHFLYSTCFKMFLLEMSEMVREFKSGAKIKLFFERGPFNYLAKEGFEMFVADFAPLASCLISAEEVGWEECVPLQAADFMAYQGFQRVDSSLKGKDQVRKSLRALLRTNNPISVAHVQDENFADLMRMIQNAKAGRPVAEGTSSGLKRPI